MGDDTHEGIDPVLRLAIFRVVSEHKSTMLCCAIIVSILWSLSRSKVTSSPRLLLGSPCEAEYF